MPTQTNVNTAADATLDRALEIAALSSAAPGPGGAPIQQPIEVRQVLGAPDLDVSALIQAMQRIAPQWLAGCRLRPCWFEPTFNKHVGALCAGLQVHVEDGAYYHHRAFRPWRLFALAFKALRTLRADYPLWADFPYEYEFNRRPIDVINGSELLRQWVDDAAAAPADLDALAAADESAWALERQPFLLY